MNSISSSVELKRPIWQTVAMLTLGLWLGASLVLDLVIMPSLFVSGMMTQAEFATAGYVIFWNFNRLELLSAATLLTSVLAWSNGQSQWHNRAIFLSVVLLAVSLLETYFLTPNMCATGIQLNLFAQSTEVPATMNLLHGSYWLLEAVKLIAGGTVLNWCWRQG
ncbi:DUF4149 domain-containing protein [Iningainema tapete]|uniref:DUF4149 domain-containing protein n=1 Tax=Iningainema tapete BLCC-T55 TaxID=2748662 RepID=A0A8J7BYL6_9CYAN|nr:DUF4149 domain-containing protein [Iningainema tapete]MBD2775967.1 DUF4149 domain-containing protein [Iningainema tapete BLCC-T55]